MEAVRVLVGAVLPYLALAVFAAGMIYRVRVWLKLPSPAITLFPAPADGPANLRNVAWETVLFRSLLRGDRLLWIGAWLFHVTLALIFAGHLRVFFNADRLLAALGLSERGIQALSAGAGGAAGVVVAATGVFLLGRRLVIRRVREITGWSDCLILLLLGAVILTGNMMRFGSEHFDLTLTRRYFASLFSFGDAARAAVLGDSLFLTHLSLALALIMIIPFSKLLHFGGFFFTHQLIRKH